MSESRRLLLLFYDYVPDVLVRRAPHREAHLAHVGGWRDEGRLTEAGAVGDPVTGGLLVFDVDSPAEVERFVADDPYVHAGLVKAWRVEPWTVVG